MDYLDYKKYYIERDGGAVDKTISPGGKWLETELVSAWDLPDSEVFHERLGEVVKDPRTPWHEVEFHKVLGGAVDIWQLSCHQTDVFNPRGYDFYFRGDGTYLGFHES